MRIALVVQGRFHAFDLARALLARGHTVVVFTNYPVWAAARFGLPAPAVRSCWLHGLAARIAARLGPRVERRLEPLLHRWFGRWAARAVRATPWDVIHCWSGVSEELLDEPGVRGMTLLMRGSAHIGVQRQILDEESARVGVAIDRPSDWMVARERREYARADRILVLSTFARRSFERDPRAGRKAVLLRLGTDTRAFAPRPGVVEARLERIRSGVPLTVLFVGALSYQKGLWDLAEVVRSAGSTRFRFRFIGPQPAEARPALTSVGDMVELVGKVSQAELPRLYESGDVFVFPTLQDGFAVVIAQARAAGLPVIASTNCGAPDLVREGRDGWIVPIRSPAAILSRLAWCDTRRAEFAALVAALEPAAALRDWSDVAADFESLVQTTTPVDGKRD